MKIINKDDPLSIRVARELRKWIICAPDSTSRLPSEPEMASLFGVSRGTIRSALTILEREGAIVRRQGAGTFINKYFQRFRTRAELAYEFTELIQMAGYSPDIQLIKVEQQELPEDIADHLGIPPQILALWVTKLFSADKQPAIFCTDIIPFDLFRFAWDEKELCKPIFEVLQHYCGQKIELDLTEIIPDVADESLAHWLNIKPGHPLLRFDEIGLNKDGKAILFSRIYFKDEYIRFTVLRKKV